jgi:SAM-dependent methyltransferase
MTSGRETSAFTEFEYAGWQRLAGGYDTYFKQLVAQTIEPLLDAAQVEAGCRLLDLCSGPGYVAERARRRGAIPIGLDFSGEMIAIARQRYPELAFQEGDAECVPFPDGCFDAVVMNFGMHHLGRPARAAAEAARVLRPGGRLAFTVWAAPSESIGHRIILSAIETYGTLDLPLPEGPPMFRFSDPDECHRLFAAAGFVNGTARTLDLSWEIPLSCGLINAGREGGVRLALLLDAQTPQALQRIEEAVSQATRQYIRGARFHIPVAATLASAVLHDK